MFDLLGWTWEYEPVDLNGWIPDFVITNARWLLYVEVKPVWKLPEDATKKAQDALGYIESDELQEIAPNTEVLIVGAGLMTGQYDDYYFGWLSDGAFNWWVEAVLQEPCDKTDSRYGLTAGCVGWYADRIRGCGGPCCEYDGDHNYRVAPIEDFQRLWAQAGNTVQWKAPK
jgi:hypothetical protein